MIIRSLSYAIRRVTGGRCSRLFLLSMLLSSVSVGRQALAEQLSFRSYGALEGLTNAWPSCLHQDIAGYILACTEHGLFAYDGRRFFNLGPQQGLPEGGIAEGLIFDSHRRVVLRYPHAIYISTTAISTLNPPTALTFHAAMSTPGPIADDGTGQLVPWMDSALFTIHGQFYSVRTDAETGRSRIEAGVEHLHTPTVPLQDRSPLASNGTTLWVAEADGRICGLTKMSEHCFGPAQGLPNDVWISFLTRRDGHLLARSATRLIDVDVARGHVVASVLPDQGGAYANYPYSLLLAQTPSGQLLTQSTKGLIVQQGSGWTTLVTNDGLPPETILSVLFDRDKSLWLGVLGKGAMRGLGYGAWQNLDRHDGLASDILWQMVRQPDGPLWVATDGGVDAIGGAGRAMLAHRHYDKAAFAVALDDYGHLWRSEGSTAVSCITLSTGETSVFPLAQVNQILRGSGSRLWFVSEKGLYVVDGSVAVVAPKLFPGATDGVTFAALAADGSLWLLRQQDLLHLHTDGSVVSIKLHWPQADFEPLLLTVSKQGAIWVGGAGGGLYRFGMGGDRVATTTRFGTPDIVSNSVVSLLIDSRGWLWAGTDSGLSVYDGKRWVSANNGNGLIGNDLDQASMLEDADGSMWFGTTRGLSHLLDPAQLFRQPKLQPVITSVMLGEAVYKERAVPFSRAPLSVQFGALNFQSDSALRFRYRLDGVDEGWADTASGYARYASIPAGRHRFEVVAYDLLTHQTSQPISILIRMSKPWWLWWPLLVLYVLAGLGSAYGVLRLRVRLLVKQRRALQREVELRTKEIREAQATDSLTGLLTRGEIQARLVAALAQADRTSQIAVGLVDIDHFKRINDRFGHLVGDEILKEMGRRLKLALKQGEYAGRYGGEEILIVLEAEQVPEVNRIQVLSAAACGMPFHADGEIIDVTCSIGVAHEHARDDWKSLIGRADKALYRAKAEGRDRIIVSISEVKTIQQTNLGA